MLYKPYSIFTPPFDPTSGGIRVMWGLYGHLLAKGQIVHVNAKYEDDDFIAIYPEIAQGNPLGAKTVVRYILNKPGVMGGTNQLGQYQAGPTEFEPTDIKYYFSRLFGETDAGHYMFLPILNTHLFKDLGKTRNKTAYFVGKGEDTGKHPANAILIDRRLAADQGQLAELLNECEVLYSYDPVSAMTELARLCGCRIVMINSTYDRSDYLKYEPGINGMSWGSDTGVPLNVEGFRSHYQELKMVFNTALNRFIEETQMA